MFFRDIIFQKSIVYSIFGLFRIINQGYLHVKIIMLGKYFITNLIRQNIMSGLQVLNAYAINPVINRVNHGRNKIF